MSISLTNRINHSILHLLGWVGKRLQTEVEWKYAARSGLLAIATCVGE